MKLRVVLVEPKYDGNVGLVGKIVMTCAASFEMVRFCQGDHGSLPTTRSALESP
jgi:hypothetical protein